MAPPPSAFEFDIPRLFQLYAARDHDRLSAELLRGLEHFSTTVYLNEASIRADVVPFLTAFLTLFVQADYAVPEGRWTSFVYQNTLISNLTALTPFRTTDAFLEILNGQPANLVKVLTLYSARNAVRCERREFFDADPRLASLWYTQFCEIYKSGLVRDDVLRHLAEHLGYRDERMVLSPGMTEPYFASSYVDGVIDRPVKQFLNAVVRREVRFTCVNRPDPRKIAVVSDFWLPQHSVYRNYSAYVEALRERFHLTLFHSFSPREDLDTGMFDEVRRLENRNGLLAIDPLLSNDFQVAYFPDVGMTELSILVANIRFAPIQICSPGHSVSTWGADIDYFVSGADVELPAGAERNYSERLVLLPGMGVIHNRPRYEPTGARKRTNDVVINCPWTGHKICAPFLRTLRTVLDRAGRPVRLRIFPAAGISENNAHGAFLADLAAVLGRDASLEVRPQLPYAEYMRLMEEGDLSLDSHHFAGCNTIADSLFLRKPTVVWEGDKWYNRIGPAMLRLVGQDEFICTSEEEYVERAVELIRDDAKRAAVAARLAEVDLDATIFSTRHAPAFRRAVEHLIANHDALQREGARTPIVIAEETGLPAANDRSRLERRSTRTGGE